MDDWYSNYIKSVNDSKYRQQLCKDAKLRKLYSFFDIIVECLIKSNTKSYINYVFYTVQYELPCKEYHTSWEDFKYGYSYDSNFPPVITLDKDTFYVKDMNMYFHKYMKDKYKLPFYYLLFKINFGKLKRKETY